MAITEQVRNNMNKVIETLNKVSDKYGYFELVSLKATGLTRLEVIQAISFINEETGYKQIKQERLRYEWGTDYQWCWGDARKYRLEREQAAAVAEVERMFQ